MPDRLVTFECDLGQLKTIPGVKCYTRFKGFFEFGTIKNFLEKVKEIPRQVEEPR